MGNFGPRFWLIAALSLGPAVANSFARFAYALLLPAMRADLGLNYSQAGALNTANALGYLAGALIAARYVSHMGTRRLFCIGMMATVLAITGSGLTGEFIAQLCLRAVAGVGGAMVFICGAVLASSVFADRPHLSSSAIAVYFGGAGGGIALSGIGIRGCCRSRATTRGASAGLPSAASRHCSPRWASGRPAGSRTRPLARDAARGLSPNFASRSGVTFWLVSVTSPT